MATFAKKTFNAAGYASFRPNYPRQLFDFVFRYHERTPGARWDLAVDLGCGTGQATTELTPFKRVIGVEPGTNMVNAAKEELKKTGLDASHQFEYVQSSAESLPFLQDGTVDLLIAAQACHWFDWNKIWPEAARVLRKGGSLAFWGYSELRFSKYPSLTPLINAYAQGKDPKTSVGPFWEQPGRSILDGHLNAVPTPQDVVPGKFSNFERVYFAGDHYPELSPRNPVILRKTMTWDDFLSYLHTWSSLHTFQERNPEDFHHPEGDLATRFVRTLRDEIKTVGKDEENVEIEWPLAMIMAKRA